MSAGFTAKRWVLPWSLLVIWHLPLLWAPPVHFDEIPFVDYALHGKLSLWLDVLPVAHRGLSHVYGLGTLAGHEAVLGAVLRLLGVSVVKARLLPAVAALVGWGLLMAMAQNARRPWVALGALWAAGMSGIFFSATHSVRPEGWLLMFMCLNFAWCWWRGGRATGAVCGLLAGAAWVFHPAIVFFWATFPLLVFWHDGKSLRERRPAYLAWLAGAVVGTLYSLHVFNSEDLGWFLGLTGGRMLSRPPLLEWNIRVWDLLGGLFQWFDFRQAVKNEWYSVALGAALSLTVLTLRRWRRLIPFERMSALLASGLLLSYGLLSPYPDPLYGVYVLPWISLTAVFAVWHLFQREWPLDAVDGLLSASLFVATWLASGRCWPGGMMLALWIVVLGVSAWYAPMRWRWAVLAGLFCVALMFPENITASVRILSHLAGQQVGRFLLWILPAVAILAGRTRLQARAGQAAAVYALIVVSLFAAQDARLVWRGIRKAAVSSELRDRMEQLTTYRRLVGPMSLWLYNPAVRLQADEAVWVLEQWTTRPYALEALAAYKPDYVLWQKSRSAELVGFFKQHHALALRATIEDAWEFPFGSYVGIRMEPLKKVTKS